MFSQKVRSTVSAFLSLSRRCPKGAASVAFRAMSSTTYNYETINVLQPQDFVMHVELNRPEKRNAMNMKLYKELLDCFQKLSFDGDCRAIVLSGAGKMFTAGIDLMDLASGIMSAGDDPGRKSMFLRRFVFELQESCSIVEKCPKPVIAATHGACIGGGVDLITCCDIRYATHDCYFQVKEVDVGLAADLGTLQRLPKVVGNDSYARELALSARKTYADEAKQFGLISRIFQERSELIDGAVEMAASIASKSPVAVQGTKVNMVFSRDHTVQEGLEYVATWNQSMLQSEDLMKAATAAMQKETAIFSKL